MKTVGITGGTGFVGIHLQFFLNEHKEKYNFIVINKADFFDASVLGEKISRCDFLVHLAAVNRGEENFIYDSNIDLTRKVIDCCDVLGVRPKIIFLSSTHNTRNTAYGRSKKESETMIRDWGDKNNIPVSIVVAPNLFGEFLRPYHNSFIGTFCSELMNRKNSKVDPASEVELLYVKNVCKKIFDIIEKNEIGLFSLEGKKFLVSEVYNILKIFRDDYFSGIIPIMHNQYDILFFNTFRSILYPKHFPVFIDLKSDNRGFLFEIVKENTGGQTFFSETKPGIVRGNHYHTRKIERFCVIKGEAIIRLRKLFSNEVVEYKVSGKSPVYVDLPTYYTHSIENIGNESLLTIFWTNEIFNPEDPDTFEELVIK